MKKALIHDWFNDYAGAEKCVESITNVWDDFEIFSLIDFFDSKDRAAVLKGKNAKTSFIQNLPFVKKYYRNYLPLFPLAVEQFDLRTYDVVISSSHAVAKGVLTSSEQLHISYVHTPIRYAWDLYQQYLDESGLNKGFKSVLVRYFLSKIRAWDISSVNRVDYYIANSHYIAKRIKKIYGRDSVVIYPPVDVDRFELCTEKDDYYLTASRLVPYKKIDLIIKAFNNTNRKLVVIGSGPDYKKLSDIATRNVKLLGYQDDAELIAMMKKAKAFVFAAEEDFGILPVEAQACGTPVICLGKGGTKETVIDMETGVHFSEQSIVSLQRAIDKFEHNTEIFNPKKIRTHSLKFSKERFEREIKEYVEAKYEDFKLDKV